MNEAPSCWVLSDGRRGIENQALGLAEALARLRPLKLSAHKISSGQALKALPPKLLLMLRSKPENYGLTEPLPTMAIGCGRQAIAPLIALKRVQGKRIYTVYIQAPRISSSHFDLVIAPDHDQVRGANILSMIGSPNRITQELLDAERSKFAKKIENVGAPHVAMLIGGNSKSYSLDQNAHAQHIQIANDLLAQNKSLLISCSRRTPDFAVSAYKKLAQDSRRIWFWNGEGENPYFAFLAAANAILVTQDSTNMLTEACATGAPVFSLPMSGNAGKFQRLYTALEDRCGLVPYAGQLDTAAYEPLDETQSTANSVWGRFERHQKRK